LIEATAIDRAKDLFGALLKEQIARVNAIKSEHNWINYEQISPIVIGTIGGDGIGPAITLVAQNVLEELLIKELEAGKVEFRPIDGLTIENRAIKGQAIPEDVLESVKKCHVTLKGPTTTPERGGPWPNIESANVGLRKALDLFANVRPVKVPSQGIDWTFFRENTEDMYAVGNQGIDVTSDLAVDFKVITSPGSERIIEAAFNFARDNGKKRVTIVTKANIVKTTDGKFLSVAESVANRYPGIDWDSWYIDIMTAKLLDPARRSDFEVFALPNLYGDILTDEAAEIQGGVGTAGSANLGKRYAMFEAIHGSAPRMVAEGRDKYADPSSMLRASSMLLQHIGFSDLAKRLTRALEICVQSDARVKVTGRSSGATGEEFGQYVLETIRDPMLFEGSAP
jgi:isocitrate dehydrogenase (NAD+)